MVQVVQSHGNAGIFELVDVEPVREHRGWFIGLGVVFMILGVLAILLPFIASLVTTIVLGWLMIIGGLFQGVHAIQNRRWGGSGWAIASSVLYVVAGLLLVAFPVTGTLTLTLVLAAFFIASGVLKIIRAVQHRRMHAWPWLLFDGILSLALGLLVGLGWPSTAAWALGLLVGIDLVFSGSSMLLIGLGAGPMARTSARAGV
jgi:uncharacterized membrane protein HdeD (DUF308 family)